MTTIPTYSSLFDFASFPDWIEDIKKLASLAKQENWSKGNEPYWLLENYLKELFSFILCNQKQALTYSHGKQLAFFSTNLFSKSDSGYEVIYAIFNLNANYVTTTASTTYDETSPPYIFNRWGFLHDLESPEALPIQVTFPMTGANKEPLDIFDNSLEIVDNSLSIHSEILRLIKQDYNMERTMKDKNLNILLPSLESSLAEIKLNRLRAVPCVDEMGEISFLVPVTFQGETQPSFVLLLKRMFIASDDVWVPLSAVGSEYIYTGCLTLEAAYIHARLLNTIEVWWLRQAQAYFTSESIALPMSPIPSEIAGTHVLIRASTLPPLAQPAFSDNLSRSGKNNRHPPSVLYHASEIRSEDILSQNKKLGNRNGNEMISSFHEARNRLKPINPVSGENSPVSASLTTSNRRSNSGANDQPHMSELSRAISQYQERRSLSPSHIQTNLERNATDSRRNNYGFRHSGQHDDSEPIMTSEQMRENLRALIADSEAKEFQQQQTIVSTDGTGSEPLLMHDDPYVELLHSSNYQVKDCDNFSLQSSRYKSSSSNTRIKAAQIEPHGRIISNGTANGIHAGLVKGSFELSDFGEDDVDPFTPPSKYHISGGEYIASRNGSVCDGTESPVVASSQQSKSPLRSVVTASEFNEDEVVSIKAFSEAELFVDYECDPENKSEGDVEAMPESCPELLSEFDEKYDKTVKENGPTTDTFLNTQFQQDNNSISIQGLPTPMSLDLTFSPDSQQSLAASEKRDSAFSPVTPSSLSMELSPTVGEDSTQSSTLRSAQQVDSGELSKQVSNVPSDSNSNETIETSINSPFESFITLEAMSKLPPSSQVIPSLKKSESNASFTSASDTASETSANGTKKSKKIKQKQSAFSIWSSSSTAARKSLYLAPIEYERGKRSIKKGTRGTKIVPIREHVFVPIRRALTPLTNDSNHKMKFPVVTYVPFKVGPANIGKSATLGSTVQTALSPTSNSDIDGKEKRSYLSKIRTAPSSLFRSVTERSSQSTSSQSNLSPGAPAAVDPTAAEASSESNPPSSAAESAFATGKSSKAEETSKLLQAFKQKVMSTIRPRGSSNASAIHAAAQSLSTQQPQPQDSIPPPKASTTAAIVAPSTSSSKDPSTSNDPILPLISPATSSYVVINRPAAKKSFWSKLSATTSTKETAISSGPFYSYDDIVQMKVPNVDVERKEQYLSDQDFMDKVGMDRASFYALPLWRQVAKKKLLNLHQDSAPIPTITSAPTNHSGKSAGIKFSARLANYLMKTSSTSTTVSSSQPQTDTATEFSSRSQIEVSKVMSPEAEISGTNLSPTIPLTENPALFSTPQDKGERRRSRGFSEAGNRPLENESSSISASASANKPNGTEFNSAGIRPLGGLTKKRAGSVEGEGNDPYGRDRSHSRVSQNSNTSDRERSQSHATERDRSNSHKSDGSQDSYESTPMHVISKNRESFRKRNPLENSTRSIKSGSTNTPKSQSKAAPENEDFLQYEATPTSELLPRSRPPSLGRGNSFEVLNSNPVKVHRDEIPTVFSQDSEAAEIDHNPVYLARSPYTSATDGTGDEVPSNRYTSVAARASNIAVSAKEDLVPAGGNDNVNPYNSKSEWSTDFFENPAQVTAQMQMQEQLQEKSQSRNSQSQLSTIKPSPSSDQLSQTSTSGRSQTDPSTAPKASTSAAISIAASDFLQSRMKGGSTPPASGRSSIASARLSNTNNTGKSGSMTPSPRTLPIDSNNAVSTPPNKVSYAGNLKQSTSPPSGNELKTQSQMAGTSRANSQTSSKVKSQSSSPVSSQNASPASTPQLGRPSVKELTAKLSGEASTRKTNSQPGSQSNSRENSRQNSRDNIQVKKMNSSPSITQNIIYLTDKEINPKLPIEAYDATRANNEAEHSFNSPATVSTVATTRPPSAPRRYSETSTVGTENSVSNASSKNPSPDQQLSHATKFSDGIVTNFYSYDELVGFKLTTDNGVDVTQKERYLDDATFEQKFQMSRQEFANMPKWKRDTKKKQLGLF